MSSLSRQIILLSSNSSESRETAAQMICENFPFSLHLQLSEPIKKAVHHLYGQSCAQNAYHSIQDHPHADFLGLSPSIAYSHMAEWIKDNYGMTFCSQILSRTIENFGSKRLFVISDLLHRDQAQPLIDLAGQENVLHLKIVPEHQDSSKSLTPEINLPRIHSHQVFYTQEKLSSLRQRIYCYVNYWLQTRRGCLKEFHMV